MHVQLLTGIVAGKKSNYRFHVQVRERSLVYFLMIVIPLPLPRPRPVVFRVTGIDADPYTGINTDVASKNNYSFDRTPWF